MTGRDLILYILQNGLENEEVFKDGRLLGFMRPAEAAVKFAVGESTIRSWIAMNVLQSVKIGNFIFIPADAKNPIIVAEGVENDG